MKTFLLSLFTISIILLTGCSKKPQEMSTVRSDLILDIFKLIKQGRHEEAYIKVKKLKELDPTNTHLPILEEVEKNNSELQKVNALLKDRKKQSEAAYYLKNIIERQGYMEEKNSSRATEKLKDLLRLDELSGIIVDPKPVFRKNQTYLPASKVLDQSIEEFILLTQKWSLSPTLRNKVIRQKRMVLKLRREEALRAVQSLELFAPGLSEREFQTMMALSIYSDETGTK